MQPQFTFFAAKIQKKTDLSHKIMGKVRRYGIYFLTLHSKYAVIRLWDIFVEPDKLC